LDHDGRLSGKLHLHRPFAHGDAAPCDPRAGGALEAQGGLVGKHGVVASPDLRHGEAAD
jgi:hypothetical protein